MCGGHEQRPQITTSKRENATADVRNKVLCIPDGWASHLFLYWSSHIFSGCSSPTAMKDEDLIDFNEASPAGIGGHRHRSQCR